VIYSDDPFRHWIIDDFLPVEMAEQAAWDFHLNSTGPYLPGTSVATTRGWIARHHLYSKYKFTRTTGLPETVERVMTALESEGMRQYLYTLTGIGPLTSDPDRFGGGQHVTYLYGRLGVHADFTHHPKTGMRRALNLLLYLNYLKDGEQWCAEELASSALELWSKDMKRCVKKIAPVFNRAVIFETSATSYHGHPEPLQYNGSHHDLGMYTPEGRISLAVYYYVPATENDERLKTTDYRPRPWEYTLRARRWVSRHIWNRHG